MAFTYPPNGSSSTSGNEKAIQLITGAPAGWYSPKGVLNTSNRYTDPFNVTLVPYSFSKSFSVTAWSVNVREWESAGATFKSNGARYEVALYASDANNFTPTTLISALGYVDIPTTRPGSTPTWQPINFSKILTSPITLDANKVYWVAFRGAIKNGSGGYTSGDGVEIQQVVNSGIGISSSFPSGDNTIAFSNGENSGVFDYANGMSSFGTWVSSHSGLYPFVDYAPADMVTQTAVACIHLKGSAI